MEVDIILPAVSGLVLVREPGVEWDGLLQILHFYFRMQENYLIFESYEYKSQRYHNDYLPNHKCKVFFLVISRNKGSLQKIKQSKLGKVPDKDRPVVYINY